MKASDCKAGDVIRLNEAGEPGPYIVTNVVYAGEGVSVCNLKTGTLRNLATDAMVKKYIFKPWIFFEENEG